MANPLFARKPLSLLLEELKGENPAAPGARGLCSSRVSASAQ